MAIPAVLAEIGLPVLVRAVSAALQNMDHPAAKGAGEALGGLEEALAKKELSAEELEEANRHMETLAALESKELQTNISEINQSLREEVSSDDIYVRRMRPTFGYLMALSWAAQMFGLAYVIIFQTSEAHLVLQAMESLGTIWAVGLSVLGIYVYKRSEDKKLMGQGTSLLSSIFKKEDTEIEQSAPVYND